MNKRMNEEWMDGLINGWWIDRLMDGCKLTNSGGG